jgi:hypothetical protein
MNTFNNQTSFKIDEYDDYDDFAIGCSGGGGGGGNSMERKKKSKGGNGIYNQKHVRVQASMQQNSKIKVTKSRK